MQNGEKIGFLGVFFSFVLSRSMLVPSVIAIGRIRRSLVGCFFFFMFDIESIWLLYVNIMKSQSNQFRKLYYWLLFLCWCACLQHIYLCAKLNPLNWTISYTLTAIYSILLLLLFFYSFVFHFEFFAIGSQAESLWCGLCRLIVTLSVAFCLHKLYLISRFLDINFSRTSATVSCSGAYDTWRMPVKNQMNAMKKIHPVHNVNFTCTFKITSVKIFTIDKCFGSPCTVHFFILYRIAIGELLNFDCKRNNIQHIIQSYKQQFIAQNGNYAPVWLFINLSVIFWMLEMRPYFANSCLTSWCKLMRGTPNTNKYFDSLTIVYTWNGSKCTEIIFT